MNSSDNRDRVSKYFTGIGARWQDTYTSPTPIGHHVSTRLRCCTVLLGNVEGKRLLDLGCGTGALLHVVGSTLNRYEGVDLTPAMVDATREQIHAMGLESRASVRQGDVGELAFPSNHFDAVVALGLLGFVDHPLTVVREAVRVAKPGARLVFSTAGRASVDRWVRTGLAPLRAALRPFTGKRRHAPMMGRGFADAAFEQLLESAGCTVVDARHHDKRVLPYPFTVVAPQLAARAAALVEDRAGFTLFSTGYIVACSKR